MAAPMAKTNIARFIVLSLRPELPDNARNAARFAPRRLDLVFEKAARGRPEITGTRIGPGAAFVVGVARRLAGLAVGIRGDREVAVIPALPVDGELGGFVARLG